VTGRVIVLAQDLIWADRLARAVQAAGAEPVRVASLGGLEGAIYGCPAAIIDLTALAYDGVAAIEMARAAGSRVLAVGQHDDHELRKRALAAGADRVYAYRKLFEDGPATIEAWLARPAEIEA
jgi:DNA-binding NarL/FixJ family response regulator